MREKIFQIQKRGQIEREDEKTAKTRSLKIEEIKILFTEYEALQRDL